MFAMELHEATPISHDGEIPPRLDEMPPGPFLAAILSSIDVDTLSGHDRVVVLRAEQRMASHFQARTYNSMRSVCDSYSAIMGASDAHLDEVFENSSAEIRAALALTRRSADGELDFALSLNRRLPQVAAAFLNGDIDMRRARVFDRQTEHLPEHTARLVADRIIEEAPHLTTGQLRARLRRLCVEADPEEAEERYESAHEERRTISELTESGTADYMIFGSDPQLAAAASDNVNRIAKSLKTAGEQRTMDQLRADVAIDLLRGETIHQTTPGGSVNIHVDLTTLAGLDDKAAELAGYGPVQAEIARKVASSAEHAKWKYVVVDNGLPVATGTLQRRPTVSTRRAVRAVYPTCVFPGCRMPAEECDLDHTTPWAEGGPTDADHLAPACRHDHVVRHRAGWTYTRLPNGDHSWTSPLGRLYITRARGPP